ncbi:hypothetical protein EN871_00545 [bacterium M00.F.Ca.ET.228.01.1.1]|nr:hypothetical protein EN871_00545 [bacterium M00.F.Ca.ET.228.01.1.1]TGS05131.1 hypothetical protein EN834_00545 [bacterium M00.F.Ca.ET.191.01.1.1]TGU10067.1 hypothetical protein EN798_00545 [bacterium M00.F.Ca.ET.155.01.1.1]
MIDLKQEIDALYANRGKYFRVFPGYITHIRFPRYKNMASGARIDFDFPVTALVGANGSGKTSVLNALYGAPMRKSTGDYWFSTKVDPIEEGDGSPNRFIYGHYNADYRKTVETRKARVRKFRNGREDPNYWEPTKESPGDDMEVPAIPQGKTYHGRSGDRWNPVSRYVMYINFRKELSAFDKYFYFGKDPALQAAKTKARVGNGANVVSSLKILNKKDQVRHDATLLARVISSGDTSETFRKRKIATENRLLPPDQLQMVSFILGRDYVEARWIRHRLFKGDGGVSIVFKTKSGSYSEAFAGSGEVAVTSCVVQVMENRRKGTLLLLDEPEVSLHPGAQERLLAFLAKSARQKQMQVVFSTHSPHMVSALPDEAIKTFFQLPTGAFSVLPATHPYAAFRRLGAVHGQETVIVVEDRLAKSVVDLAISLIEDEAVRQVFRVEIAAGGADSILNYRIPVFAETGAKMLVLLDGDKRVGPGFVHPDTIPAAEDYNLDEVIKERVAASPMFLIDGGANGGNNGQRVAAQRKYLAWVCDNLRYIPTSCPEELVLQAENLVPEEAAGISKNCKAVLHELASKALGRKASSEQADSYGEISLAKCKNQSPQLVELRDMLLAWLKTVRG